MAFRELTMIDVREVLRRWQAGQRLREISRGTGLDRKTVRRYLKAAVQCEVQREVPLDQEQLREVVLQVQARPLPPQSEQRLALGNHQDEIQAWLQQERPLRLTKVLVLLERKGVQVSYATLRRFVADVLGWRRRPPTVLIDDPPPGQEAQVDFGEMGVILDRATGRRRRLWVLVVTLSHSRYQFVWPTFTQTLEAVIAGLEAAWRFFGGVPKMVIVDNLKPVVTAADAMSPRLSEGFVEYSQARGVIADPARVRHPKDKPRVENQVAYVRESWFAGEQFESEEQARESAAYWCAEIAGRRVHGTTRKVPREAFDAEERAHMQPAPGDRFEVPRWSEAKVHPDHHIQVAKALYSVPTQYIGKRVRVRLDSQSVRIYLAGEMIKMHPRRPPGGRSTDPSDYPSGKQLYALRSVDSLRDKAARLAPFVGAYAERLLEGPLPWTRMRQAYGLLRLCERHGVARVDEICKRALAFDVIDVRRIDRMLKSATECEQQAATRGKLVPLPCRFARDPGTFGTMPRRADEEAP